MENKIVGSVLNDLQAVEVSLSWRELFGNNESLPGETKRHRWEEWKQLTRDTENGIEIVKYWETFDEICSKCESRIDDWCTFVQLPCTANPILTFNENIVGLACMGVGYIPK
jgi:hypothetical protein